VNTGRTIRVSEKTHRNLQELAEGSTIQAVVEEAVEDLSRKRFFQDLDAGYSALQADPDAWATELEERTLWDDALGKSIRAKPESTCNGVARLSSRVQVQQEPAQLEVDANVVVADRFRTLLEFGDERQPEAGLDAER
jgi:hypothetical protein